MKQYERKVIEYEQNDKRIAHLLAEVQAIEARQKHLEDDILDKFQQDVTINTLQGYVARAQELHLAPWRIEELEKCLEKHTNKETFTVEEVIMIKEFAKKYVKRFKLFSKMSTVFDGDTYDA